MQLTISAKIFALLLFVIGLQATSGLADQLAPSFGGASLVDGRTINLSDFRGKLVYLDFWASWCPPCRECLPIYDELRRQVGSTNFEVIAVNIDDPSEDGRKFLREHPVSYPTIADPQGRIARQFNIKAMPTSFLIDHRGNIILTKSGFQPGDEAALKARVVDMLRALR